MWNKIKLTENEEIICWFKVSTYRKKVRNKELELLDALKKICEKHNFRYFASGWTLIWAVRHKWFIPRDDDIDTNMFRNDYEKFCKIANKELPNNIRFSFYHQWWWKLWFINTSALGDDNRWDKDLIWWISIDIFPIDYASKYSFVNKIKTITLLSLRAIILAQKSDAFIKRMKRWKRFFIYICKYVFRKINCWKVYKLHEKIAKKVFFKWDKIYNWWCPYQYYPKNIFNEFHNVEFENTTICIPDWYDTYLRIAYWNYMKPIVWEWWHHCRYSIDKSYKDIIKSFDKWQSNEENYNKCKDLFAL